MENLEKEDPFFPSIAGLFIGLQNPWKLCGNQINKIQNENEFQIMVLWKLIYDSFFHSCKFKFMQKKLKFFNEKIFFLSFAGIPGMFKRLFLLLLLKVEIQSTLLQVFAVKISMKFITKLNFYNFSIDTFINYVTNFFQGSLPLPAPL